MRPLTLISIVALKSLAALAIPQTGASDPCLTAALAFEIDLPIQCPLAASKYNSYLDLTTDPVTAGDLLTSGLKEACPKMDQCLRFLAKAGDVAKTCKGVKAATMIGGYPYYPEHQISTGVYPEVFRTIPTTITLNETLCYQDQHQYCYSATTTAIALVHRGDSEAVCRATPTCWRRYNSFDRIGTAIRFGDKWGGVLYYSGAGAQMAAEAERKGCNVPVDGNTTSSVGADVKSGVWKVVAGLVGFVIPIVGSIALASM
ncbi:hypothetical protein HK097_006017 [Rhizophlyctis rosea]|uniref:Uncharacterized protein n=1 Tax=Rhizophlyctis rosea TaxID=64517 RepID=A0AAD5X5W1_9FUNG|nr:hypothetical protein HK097_006017 [Rhizophlyctis rosea]